MRMPEQFASPISQGGTNLSGGQKQRLAIARAIVRRPDVYVFDDSFSALDFATDARLRAALKAETADATVFIVAQRISTVMNADRIVVLDDGRVAGIGTHAELLEEQRDLPRDRRHRRCRSRRWHERAADISVARALALQQQAAQRRPPHVRRPADGRPRHARRRRPRTSRARCVAWSAISSRTGRR